ncbi:MAG TPA: MBL fold metallo-hydrolase [Leucothrix mucor]|nr:MBL fold metallo-hydrolase [Leucothrix mucor]
MNNQLSHLPHGVSVLDAHYVQLGVASIYIVAQGNKVSIIETGTANSVPYILSALNELGFSPDDVSYIIPTHIHLDHAGGAGELMEQCPNAQLVIHPRGAQHMINPARLEAGTMAVYGEEKYRALYGTLKAIPEHRVMIADNDFKLDFNGRVFHFIDTPGHAYHHFCIYDELSKGIFTGDTFGLVYKKLASEQGDFIFATTTPVHFDPTAMRDSISKLLSFKPELMYLTHFGAIKPTADITTQLLKSISAFVAIAESEKANIEGRVERIERQIMQWLLKELSLRSCTLSIAEQKKWLQTDSRLNAQGLEVWLQRQEKN